MTLADFILWPGTLFCRLIGVEPTADAGLIRWMINTLVYTIGALICVWVFAV
ncbi:MAG: hypothetical protein ACJAVM_000773 [Sulfitobacter sp.]|jgi:hypothetical protein